MINVSEFKGNGQPKLKYERHGTGWIKLRKVKPQISGFPQQELAIDRLVQCGFIEIVKLGIGAKKQSHEIALIKNWRDYGTEKFWVGKGKADKPLHGGFKKKIPLETGVQ